MPRLARMALPMACVAIALGPAAKARPKAFAKDVLARPSFVVNVEHYQLKDFPVAWTKTYGKGRVFHSTLGHHRHLWEEAWMRSMHAEALKWVLRV